MPSPDALPQTPRTTLKRAPDRGRFDRPTVHAILDEGLVCHLAFAGSEGPHVIPTIYGRAGDTLYVHGSTANRALRALREGAEACLAVTLIDGLVIARSAFHHSMNYRSVILYGRMREVTDDDEKLRALRTLVEHVFPKRWPDVRGPNREELLRTLVLALPIEEGSAKVRTGPPIDEEDDYALACWAGILPLATRPLAFVDDPRLRPGLTPPDYLRDYRRGERAEGAS